MTETTEAVETIVEEVAVVYSGIAFKVNQRINALKEARDLAMTLESGLDTQAAIKKVSTELRGTLLPISRELHGIYSGIIDLRTTLLGGVGEVQKVSKREAIEKRMAADAATLAAM